MVKSKRAREAAESAVEPSAVESVNGSTATHDNKVKKRKRDVEEDAAEDDAVAGEKKKSKKEKKEKKDKKDKKDKKSKKHDKESRKEKKDKRKNLQDLPEEVVEDADEEDSEQAPQEVEAKVSNGVDGDAEAKKKEEKRARKQAKREEKKQRQQQTEQGTTDSTSKSNDKPSTSSATAPSSSGQPDNNVKSEEDPIDLDDSSANSKKDRHIVFVGNLPFSATAASISAHFASLSPVAVRCLRNRDDPNPCRGIAFVEFGKVWHQRTCLDKFHHSTFDDGVSPARKINVELT